MNAASSLHAGFLVCFPCWGCPWTLLLSPLRLACCGPPRRRRRGKRKQRIAPRSPEYVPCRVDLTERRRAECEAVLTYEFIHRTLHRSFDSGRDTVLETARRVYGDVT